MLRVYQTSYPPPGSVLIPPNAPNMHITLTSPHAICLNPFSTHGMQQHVPGTQTYLHPALPDFSLSSRGRSSSAASMASTPALASDACFAPGTPKSAGHSPPVCCYFTETQQRSRVSLELAEKAGGFLPPSSACLWLLDPQLLPCCRQPSAQSAG